MTETELEYQFCFNCNDRKQCYTKPKDCTRIQEEIGLQEMTNEEWLHTLKTEQLAEWLALKRKLIRIPETNYEVWMRWLKEKHE